jgi:hypothetical protein
MVLQWISIFYIKFKQDIMDIFKDVNEKTEFIIKRLKELDGKRVMIKSNRYDGRYIDAHNEDKHAQIIRRLDNEIHSSERFQFKIIHLESDVVVFESIEHPNSYLNITPKEIANAHIVYVASYADDPKKVDSFKFSISPIQKSYRSYEFIDPLDGATYNSLGGLYNIAIRSEMWADRYLASAAQGPFPSTPLEMLDLSLSEAADLSRGELKIHVDKFSSLLIGKQRKHAPTINMDDLVFSILPVATTKAIEASWKIYRAENGDDTELEITMITSNEQSTSLTKEVENSIHVDVHANLSFPAGPVSVEAGITAGTSYTIRDATEKSFALKSEYQQKFYVKKGMQVLFSIGRLYMDLTKPTS